MNHGPRTHAQGASPDRQRRRGPCPYVLGAVAWSVLSGSAVLGGPSVKFLSPPGAQAGTTVVVTAQGDFSWPVQVEAPGAQATVLDTKGQIRLEIPVDFPGDRLWVRLHDGTGGSAPVPFKVGSLPDVAEQEPNNARREAQPISLPASVQGVLHKRGELDSFQMELRAGELLVAQLDAHTTFGSPIDTVLHLVDNRGFVIAENHDAQGLDPRIVMPIPRDDTYILHLFGYPAQPDTRIEYFGSDECVYRLSVTTGAFLHNTLPSTLSAGGQTSSVQLTGWNLPPDAMAVVDLSRTGYDSAQLRSPLARWHGLVMPLSLRQAAIGGSSTLRSIDLPLNMTDGQIEVSSNNALPSLVPPACQQTDLRNNAANDHTLELVKDQPYTVSVEGPSLHWLTVPRLWLFDPQGKMVAEVDEAGPIRDAVLSFTPQESGSYRLRVGDRFRHGGPDYRYRITILPDQVDFGLALAQHEVVVAAGTTSELPVTVQRFAAGGTSPGAISLEAIGLPTGIAAAVVVSEPSGDTAEKVTLALTAAGDAPPWSGPIRIRGTHSEPTPLTRWAVCSERLGYAHRDLWLTVTPPKPAE